MTSINTTTAKSTRSTGWIVATGITSGLALAGMAAAGVMALAPAHAATPSGAGTHTHTVTPAKPVTPAHHTTVTKPSDSIKLLQQELGRLDYYEGPINGYDTQATIQAVTYLQRDAHLQQTGHLNSATDQALINKLIAGPNTMGK